MASDLHHISLTGRLARDSELRSLPTGTSVLGMRLAYTTQRKDGETWVEKSNYIDLTMFGRRADALAQYLLKGKRLAVHGRLEWREWEAQDGTKRQAYEVLVDELVMLDSAKGSGGSGGGSETSAPAGDASRYAADAGAGASSDDDIPF